MKQTIRLTESELHRIIKEAVNGMMNGSKRTITKQQAGQMLMSYVENSDFGDRLYEFARGLYTC